MSNANPYAAPQTANPFSDQNVSPVEGFPGLWREGNVLVLHKLAPLPNICLKSNQPATRRLKRNLQWHHPAVYLAIIPGLLVYAILAMVLMKRATLQAPLSDEWFARRRNRMLIAWGLIGVSVLMFVFGVMNVDSTDWGVFLVVASLLLCLVSAVYGAVACRLFTPKRITDEYVWLKGVHPEFLDRLPVWPYNI